MDEVILSDEEACSACLDAYVEAYNDFSSTGKILGALVRLRATITELGPTFVVSERLKRMAPTQALCIYPEWLVVRSFEAMLSQHSGQWTDSHETFLASYGVLVHQDQHPIVRHWMGLILLTRALRSDDLITAAALLSEQLHLAAEHPMLHIDLHKTSVMLGYVANRLGDFASADLYYEVAEQCGDPITAAKALDHAGMTAFNIEDYAGSRALYEKAIKILADSESHEALLQSTVCASRLAECCLLSGDPNDASEYALKSLMMLDRLRTELKYESARGVGVVVGQAPFLALKVMVKAIQEMAEPNLAMLAKALLIIGNSGLSSRLRGHEVNPGVVFVSSGMSSASELESQRGRLTILEVGYYARISESDVDELLNQSPPIMLACVYDNGRTGFDGVSLVCGLGQLNWNAWNITHACSHDGSHQGNPYDVLNGFLSGLTSESWSLSSCADVWECLGMSIFPTGLRRALGGNTIDKLKIAPIGLMWNVPFLALAVAGSPLVLRCDVMLCTPLSRSSDRAFARKAIGVLDLSISGGLHELRALKELINSSSLELVLTGRHDETLAALSNESAQLLLVSAHGSGIDGAQYILLPDRSLLSAEDFLGTCPPQYAILASCEIGRTTDPLNRDPVSIPLALLGRGSHQVLAAIRTIPSQETAKLTSETLLRMKHGSCLASAFCETVRHVLETKRDVPVDSWAALGVVSA